MPAQFPGSSPITTIQYIDESHVLLLHEVGVRSLRQLALQDAEDLTARMAQSNSAFKVTDRAPTTDLVKEWIAMAVHLSGDPTKEEDGMYPGQPKDNLL
jgi:hypothetical protein